MSEHGDTGDWGDLYKLARERLPAMYSALCDFDRQIAARLRITKGIEDAQIVGAMKDHDTLIAALRVLRENGG